MRTASVPVSALTVSRPSDGGQSTMTQSQSVALVSDRPGQPALTAGLGRKLHLGARQRDGRRNETKAVDPGPDVQLRERAPVDECVVDGAVDGGAVDPEAARGVALGIEVDDEDAVTEESQIGCEIDHGGGLPDAALLIGAGDRLAHSTSRPKHDHERQV